MVNWQLQVIRIRLTLIEMGWFLQDEFTSIEFSIGLTQMLFSSSYFIFYFSQTPAWRFTMRFYFPDISARRVKATPSEAFSRIFVRSFALFVFAQSNGSVSRSANEFGYNCSQPAIWMHYKWNQLANYVLNSQKIQHSALRLEN